jgi:phosphonate transport system substrate-binding protein
MSRRHAIVFIFIVFFPVFILGTSAYAGTDSDSGKKVIYFSAITLYHPIVMYQRYQPLMNYLTEHTPYRFELKLSQDYRDIVKFLRQNKVQVALLGGVTYIEAKRQFKVVPILKPLGHDGKPYYRSVFITQTNNIQIKGLSGLRGKSVAFASPFSTSGYLSPLYELSSKGGIKLKDLSRHANLKYHDAVAREVLRGHYDAGAVIDSVANRFKSRGLKVIHESDPIPGLPFVVREDASPQLVKAIKIALLSLNYSNLSDRKIMEQWDEEFKYGFAEADDTDYDSIRKMTDYLRRH